MQLFQVCAVVGVLLAYACGLPLGEEYESLQHLGAYGGGGILDEGVYSEGYEEHKEHPKPYNFHYKVSDHIHGTKYGQEEVSDGKTVVGKYSVHLPDGRTQVVQYHADKKNGFQAEVKYEGHAQHPLGGHHSAGLGLHGGFGLEDFNRR